MARRRWKYNQQAHRLDQQHDGGFGLPEVDPYWDCLVQGHGELRCSNGHMVCQACGQVVHGTTFDREEWRNNTLNRKMAGYSDNVGERKRAPRSEVSLGAKFRICKERLKRTLLNQLIATLSNTELMPYGRSTTNDQICQIYQDQGVYLIFAFQIMTTFGDDLSKPAVYDKVMGYIRTLRDKGKRGFMFIGCTAGGAVPAAPKHNDDHSNIKKIYMCLENALNNATPWNTEELRNSLTGNVSPPPVLLRKQQSTTSPPSTDDDGGDWVEMGTEVAGGGGGTTSSGDSSPKMIVSVGATDDAALGSDSPPRNSNNINMNMMEVDEWDADFNHAYDLTGLADQSSILISSSSPLSAAAPATNREDPYAVPEPPCSPPSQTKVRSLWCEELAVAVKSQSPYQAIQVAVLQQQQFDGGTGHPQWPGLPFPASSAEHGQWCSRRNHSVPTTAALSSSANPTLTTNLGLGVLPFAPFDGAASRAPGRTRVQPAAGSQRFQGRRAAAVVMPPQHQALTAEALADEHCGTRCLEQHQALRTSAADQGTAIHPFGASGGRQRQASRRSSSSGHTEILPLDALLRTESLVELPAVFLPAPASAARTMQTRGPAPFSGAAGAHTARNSTSPAEVPQHPQRARQRVTRYHRLLAMRHRGQTATRTSSVVSLSPQSSPESSVW